MWDEVYRMKKILVVDDEKSIVKGIKFSLEQDDMKVEVAYDGACKGKSLRYDFTGHHAAGI